MLKKKNTLKRSVKKKKYKFSILNYETYESYIIERIFLSDTKSNIRKIEFKKFGKIRISFYSPLNRNKSILSNNYLFSKQKYQLL